jgi:hypothetical protein
MISTENRAGRLAEIRIVSPVTLDEVKQLTADLRRTMMTHGKICIVGDLLRCSVFPQDIYDAFLSLLKVDNPAIERSALLLADSAVFTLQLERIVKDAGNPARRTFRDRKALLTWLGEVLRTDERIAAERFLLPKAI